MNALDAYRLDCDLVRKLKVQNTSPATCRLCLRVEPLLMSHIFPAWLWRAIKGGSNFILVDAATQKATKQQTELRAPLLCSDCELQIGKHEAYVKTKYDQWLNVERPRKVDKSTGEAVGKNIVIPEYFEVDYAHLKLFVLACFWRASESPFLSYRESKIQTDGTAGEIIPGHFKERLRKIILSNDPGNDYDYPILPTVDRTGMLANAKTMGVTYSQFEGIGFLRTFVGGALWTLALDEGHPQWTQAAPRRLRSDNRCFFDLRDLTKDPGIARVIDAAGN
ncbi:MAG: hypothetical protein U0931_33155 [Vulcanimicrobiota bacterium]